MENYLAIYNNMNGIWAHRAKWRKSKREKQILYDLTHMWNIKKNFNHKERDRICGYQKCEVKDGEIGWSWSKGTNSQL